MEGKLKKKNQQIIENNSLFKIFLIYGYGIIYHGERAFSCHFPINCSDLKYVVDNAKPSKKPFIKLLCQIMNAVKQLILNEIKR